MSLVEYELSLPENQRDRNKLVEYLKLVLQKSPNLYAVGVFEPNAFDGKDAVLQIKISMVQTEGLFLMLNAPKIIP